MDTSWPSGETLEAWELVKDCVIEGRPLKDLAAQHTMDFRGSKIFHTIFQGFLGCSKVFWGSKFFWDLPRCYEIFQDFTRAICRVSEDSPGLIYDFPVFRGFIGVGEIGMCCRDSLRRIAWTFICS
jgi:hypothetical protein